MDGPKVMLGGVERTLAPLTFRTLRKIAPRFGELAKLGNPGALELPNNDQLDLILEIVHASISRAHPEVTLDALEDLLDTSNLLPVFMAILRGSGLQEKRLGEAVSP